MSSRHLSFVAPLVLAGLACSSRPGNIVDVTTPTVVQRSPMPGASNAWVHDPIQVVFSEPLNAASAESDAAVVVTGQDGAVLGKTLKLSNDRMTLTITLTATPPVPSTIKVAFDPSITDEAGNHLTLPSDEWTWSLPDWQQPGGGEQALNTITTTTPGTAVALDGSGAPVVAFTDGDALMVKRWDSSTQSWKALGTNPLNQNASLRAYTPSLAVDASGNPYVAWVEQSVVDDAGPRLLWVKRWDPSAGDWVQLGGSLNRDPTQDSLMRPSIAVTADGPLVAWAESASPAAQVYVSRFSGNAWIPVGTSPSSGTSVPASSTAIAIDPTVGRPLVVWTEQEPEVINGLSRMVFHARVARWTGSWQNGAWTPVGSVLNVGSGADARYPALAVDASGVPTVAWAESGGTGASFVVYAKRASSSSWSLLGGGPLNTSGATAAGSVRVLLDAAGAPIVAFDEKVPSTSYSVLVKKLVSETWTPLGGILNASASNYAHMPSMVIDAGGAPLIAWVETLNGSDDTNWNVWFKRYNQ